MTKNLPLVLVLTLAVTAAVLAGRWIGAPHPVSGTVPVASPTGPPLPLPAAQDVVSVRVRRIGAEAWREVPQESVPGLVEALRNNFGSLPPPDVICVVYQPAQLELLLTTRAGYSVLLELTGDAGGIMRNESTAPDGIRSSISGVFGLRRRESDAALAVIGPILSDGPTETGK